MKTTGSLRSGWLVASLALLLAGCAVHSYPPKPPLTLSTPTDLKTIQMTPQELRRAEHNAYDRGFKAGLDYAQAHAPAATACFPKASVAPPDAPHPQTPAPKLTQPTPLTPQPTPASAYSASGPAKPLAQ